MEILEANKNDIPIIQRLAEAIWPVSFSNILSPEQIAYMMGMMYSASALEQQLSSGHIYLLLKDEDRYIAYMSYEQRTDHMKIHKIYVLPSTQKRGLGQKLIARVAEIARAANKSKLSLNVNRFNSALEFYKKLGFVVAGEENINIGQGYLMEDYILELDLQLTIRLI